MDKIILDNSQVAQLARNLANRIRLASECYQPKIYGVPRGGIPVAYLLLSLLPGSEVTTDPKSADIIVDDLIDSGATERKYRMLSSDIHHRLGRPFVALIDKRTEEWKGKWIVFPWEKGEEDQSATDIVIRLLQFIGEDPERGGLKETPQRVLKAWAHWSSGYKEDPKSILKCFEDGAQKYDEMVLQKELPFYSHCEHHLAPFFGTATIAYIPNDRIVGLSKLKRVLDVFARRLQVQERMTVQIADAINEVLQPKGVGVVLKARHLCMESRGVQAQGHYTVTSALRGKFLDDATVRGEFLNLAR